MTTATRKKTTDAKTTVTEDPIKGFKDVQIRNLAYRVSAQRIEKDTYGKAREIIGDRIDELLRKVLVFTTHTGRKTVTLEDLQGALEAEGTPLMAGGNTARDIKKSKARTKKPKQTPKEEGTSTDLPKKPHRFRPGTVVQKEIKRNQEMSDRLVFKQNRFQYYVRQSTQQQLNVALRFTKEFFKLFQIVIEEYLVCLLDRAIKASAHAGRKSLSEKDLQFVYSL